MTRWDGRRYLSRPTHTVITSSSPRFMDYMRRHFDPEHTFTLPKTRAGRRRHSGKWKTEYNIRTYVHTRCSPVSETLLRRMWG